MSIIIRNKGGKPRRVDRTPIAREDFLQQYLKEYPDILPTNEIKEDCKLVVLAREFPVQQAGFIDVLAVDQDGWIYVIETKLDKNQDKRLVVAQALDYGAGLWNTFSNEQEFLDAVDDAVKGTYPGEDLRSRLTKELEISTETAIRNIGEAFSTSRYRFLFVLNNVSDQLKNVIAFLNDHSDFQFIACELNLYKDGEDMEVWIPNLHGAEVTRPSSRQRVSKRWDETLFFDEAKKTLNESQLVQLRKLYDFTALNSTRGTWGGGGTMGSFGLVRNEISNKSWYSVYSDGRIQFRFKWFFEEDASSTFPKRMKDAIEAETNLRIPKNFAVDQYFKIDQWGPQVDGIIKAMESLIHG